MTEDKLTIQLLFVEEFCSQLNSDRRDKHLTDFIIRSGDISFPCHKLVLQARSKFFRGLSSECSDYALKANASEEIAQAVIHFIYTFDIEIDLSNVFSVLPIADELELLDLTALCDECVMHLEINEGVCFTYYDLSEKYRLEQFQQKVLEYIFDSFETICDNAGFTELSLEKLLSIISSDRLKVKEERKVLELATRWIQASEERMEFAEDVLGNVRLALVDLNFEEYLLLKQSSIFTSLNTTSILDTAMRFRTTPSSRWQLCSLQTRPRQRHSIQEFLLVEAKLCYVTILYYLDPNDNQWKQLRQTPLTNAQGVPSSLSSCIYENNLVAIHDIGNLVQQASKALSWSEIVINDTSENGSNTSISLTLVERLRKNLSFDTFGASMVAIPGGIMCVGPICCKFNFSSGSWQDLPMLKTAVLSPRVFHAHNKVYVFGGHTTRDEAYYNQIQVYSLDSETWDVLGIELPITELVLSTACYEGCIYLLMSSGSIATFDVGTGLLKQYMRTELVNNTLGSCSMVVYGGNLFVLRWDKRESSIDIVDIDGREVTKFCPPLNLSSMCFNNIQQHGMHNPWNNMAVYQQQHQHQNKLTGETVVNCFSIMLPCLFYG